MYINHKWSQLKLSLDYLLGDFIVTSLDLLCEL